MHTEREANIWFFFVIMCYEILVGKNHEEEQKIAAVNGSGLYAWLGGAEWHA